MTDIFRKSGAKAIWQDYKHKQNCFVRFQTEFEIDEISKTEFFICTDTKYELYINGNLAGFGQYEDFPKHKAYDVCNIEKFVKRGKNLVSILAWVAGEDFSSMHLDGLHMVIFTAQNGGKCILKSDEKTKCSDADMYINGEIEQITNERKFNFGFDLRCDDGWKSENISSDWKNAVICDDSDITYYERPVKNLCLGDIKCGKIISQGIFSQTKGETTAIRMQYAPLSYRNKDEVLKESDGGYSILCDNAYLIIDMGEEMAGHFVMDVEAEDASVLDVAVGEHLNDMRVRSYVGGRNYAFSCVCRNGRQQMRFYIQRLAGRFLQIFAHKGIKKIHSIGLHEVYYPFDFRSTLKTNDRLFNKIYEVGVKTLDLCIHEHYEDCPQREQSLYGMDSRNQMLAGYYAFGETQMPRASIALLGESQRESGLLEITSPGIFERTIPYFSLAWVCAIREYTLFSGDSEFAKEILPKAKKTLSFFEIDEEKGLVKTPRGYENWNFYEWTEGMDNWDDDAQKQFDAPLNAYYMMALRDYAAACSYTGNVREENWAKERINTIFASFHDAFYCPEKKAYKAYIDGREPYFSQLTQAWALTGGCVPEEYKPQIRESMLSDEFVHISLSHSVYKYDALMQDSEKYAGYVLDDIEKQWGYMLYNGATTFWETILGEADFDGAGSLCHGWSATPVYIFWRYVMGIYPGEAGFKNIVPKPLFKDIVAEGSLKTPQGIFKVFLSDGKTHVKNA